MNDKIFREQLTDDIKLLQENLTWDPNIYKDEYAFNYWILSNLYNLDEETCFDNITEYNDKGIDCFVHYENNKELYLIQNKYYGDQTPLSRKEVSDFLNSPLASLKKGNYKSKELQEIFNNAINDEEYKIYLHFYITNNSKTEDITNIIDNFKENSIIAEIFYLQDIKEKYYKQSYKETKELDFKFSLKVKGSALRILPEEYELPNMSKAFYVMARVDEIYELWQNAKNKDYELFEKNIRDYLGGSGGVNNAIIKTLESNKERNNFFYYNNGITIICDDASADAKYASINNPQIVNGCQTVNSIAEALKSNANYKNDFKDIYVMAKVLVIDRAQEDDSKFYHDVVRYTNSQNAINDKVFGAILDPFKTIQQSLKDNGFLITVKQSDKYQFKEQYKDAKLKGKILELANKNCSTNFYSFKSINDIQITLETLIQLIGAFMIDAHFAYTKKSFLLKPDDNDSSVYKGFSTKIKDMLTVASMAKLIQIYKKAEFDKKNSDDKKSPSPYYLLNFIGFHLDEKNIDKSDFLRKLSIDDMSNVYESFKNLSSKYYNKYKSTYDIEYNQMIKKTVDKDIMTKVLNQHLDEMQEWQPENYQKLTSIFESMKN